MKKGGHWPPFYFSLGTSLGLTGGVSLQPSCSENGGFLNGEHTALFYREKSLTSVNITVNFSMS